MDKLFEISQDGKTLILCSNNVNVYESHLKNDSGVSFNGYVTFQNAAEEFNCILYREWSLIDFSNEYGKCKFATAHNKLNNRDFHCLAFEMPNGNVTFCHFSYSTNNYNIEDVVKEKYDLKVALISNGKYILINPSKYPIMFPLYKIELPSGIEIISQNAFSDCKNINQLHIPETIKEIRDNSFENCMNMEELCIRGKEVRISRNAFTDCPNLHHLTLAKFEINDLFLLFPNPESIETIKILGSETIYPQQILDEHANRLLTIATYYHAMGMDLSIIQGHGDDDKSYKNPGICNPFPVSGILNNQSNGVSSLFIQNWKIATGIGVCLGHNHIRAIDVDWIDYNCQVLSVDENGNQYFDRIGGVLTKVLEELGLPTDYPWVVISGSEIGFHVLFETNDIDDDINSISFTPNDDYCSDWYEPHFKRMELHWNGHLVLPPSIHNSGSEYTFRHRRLPSIAPTNICLSKLNDMINHFCAQGVFTTYDYEDNRQLELVETKKIYSSYDSYGYVDSTEYKEDSIAWLENCKTPDAYNSLAIRYVLGKGVPANKKKAFELFDKAGYASYARFNIASLIACGYFEGTVDDVEDYLRMSNDGGMAVNGWVVDGEDKFNLVRENAKKYTRQSNLYIFFDTETTGTPLNYKAPSSDARNWPRLVQLGWILMTENGKKVSDKNYIVKPNGFTIPADATKIHNITTKVALEQGRELSFVIDEFLKDFNKAKYVVGHNIDFDKKIVGAELIRLSRPDIMNSKEAFCTMKSSTDFCKIPGCYGYKYPKLQELYHKLFGRDFEDAHDAASDIEATQQCFWELRKKGLI